MIRAALLALALSSCVATTADLDRIHFRLDGMEAAIESGGDVRAAIAATKQEVAVIAREVEERSVLAWEVVLAAVSVAVPGSVAATNALRNRARAKRGEPVAIPRTT